MENKDILISLEIVHNKDLSANAKLLYGEIQNNLDLFEKDRRFFLEKISELYNITYKQVNKLEKELIDIGLICNYELTYPQIKDLLFTREKSYTCEWCGNQSTILNKHHYPIPKRLGGTKVVNICPNCHYGFHYIENNKIK